MDCNRGSGHVTIKASPLTSPSNEFIFENVKTEHCSFVNNCINTGQLND